jgi:hypothetical protein
MRHSRAAIPYAAAFFLGISLIIILAMAGPAVAAGDDDLPGTALALGAKVAQTVNSADASDVFALELTAGQEVHIQCDPGDSGSATGTLHLLVPGAAAIAAADDFDELI